MGIGDFSNYSIVCNFLSIGFCLIMMISFSYAFVELRGADFVYSFEDIEANFAPPVRTGGICGKLYIAEPPDACSPLTNKVVEQGGTCSDRFALVIRGGCNFEEKIKTAQKAGFQAAIIYDNVDGGALIAMAGISAGIKIHAVFVSKATGEILKLYAGQNLEVWIIPSHESSVWSIMAISLISILAMSALLATWFFVKRHYLRREISVAQAREFHGMSGRLVKAMPSLLFTSVTEDYCTSSTCAICLEDYIFGDRLRILPCRHKFHAFCVDSWLTTWRTFCPICKRDARTSNGEPPPSESTPLLLSNPSSVASSPLSSFRSRSSAIHIASSSQRSHATSRHHSISISPQIHSQSMSATRTSMDLRYMSSQRSPLHTSRYMSPYYPSPRNASSSYIGSSLRQQNALHYSESPASFSPYASGYSLPRCD
ncbi:receptor homology region, transmembrane domain- and RING domain-containing protein 2-like [Silene latifolia]|uniref:receptor homology region, transmembrane domain- and RING domain-containing protein 2-like n=1 Tax=Silene latifolia TaxID=37657 RepID=UPI003D779F59